MRRDDWLGAELPAPLVPAGCDIRDFGFMPLVTRSLLESEMWITGTGEEVKAALRLWCVSWHQVPAGSLPAGERMLAALSGAGAGWPAVREHALRDWVLCGDGRLYHPELAVKALEAWLGKLAARISGAEGNAKRWGVGVDVSGMLREYADAVQRLARLSPTSDALKKEATAKLMLRASKLLKKEASPPDRKGEGEGQGDIIVTHAHEQMPLPVDNSVDDDDGVDKLMEEGEMVEQPVAEIPADQGGDVQPDAGGWRAWWSEQGVRVPRGRLSDFAKLAAGWTARGVSHERMAQALAQAAKVNAGGCVAWWPGYVDKVLSSLEICDKHMPRPGGGAGPDLAGEAAAAERAAALERERMAASARMLTDGAVQRHGLGRGSLRGLRERIAAGVA
jgi:hypothetical protein